MTALLEVKDLTKTYSQGIRFFNKTEQQVLAPISFSVNAYQTLAFIGETGSGKSTIAKLLVGAEQQTSGDILLNGTTLSHLDFRQRCQHVRMIFQTSATTLNPALTIGSILEEPLRINTRYNASQRNELIQQTLKKVGLLSEHMHFYPHMLSGGQKQRVSLARAIILSPQVVILDEALASLDPSLRSQMINLLLELQQQMGLGFILISHNIGIISHFSDHIVVLKDGVVVERGDTQTILNQPQHNYTKKLVKNRYFYRAKHDKKI